MQTLLALALLAAPGGLGRAQFPVSCNAEAQEHFQRGVLALHSFFYDEALHQFDTAASADPACEMAHWGQAMTFNHPVWQEQDLDGARAALAKIGDTAKLTPLEREWIESVKILYGSDRPKRERDRLYADALDAMRAAHPGDLEVETFDALAKLGLSASLGNPVKLQMEAGALALDAFAKNPDHPGAAHYVIHAFDDPDHAILALPAARRYADIAPDAAHARHMPAHIFVQLGMWPEAIASCEVAERVSREYYAKKPGEEWKFDTHSGRWLVDLYLEQGRAADASAELTRIAAVVPWTAKPRVIGNYTETVLAYLLESGAWDRADELLAPLALPKKATDPAPAATAAPAGTPAVVAKAGKTCAAHESAAAFGPPYAELVQIDVVEIHAYAAIAKGDLRTAKREIESARGLIAKIADPEYRHYGEHDELLLRARLAEKSGDWKSAIASLKKAVELEKLLPPPSGPAESSSAHEHLGEVLLAAKKPAEAADAFAAALGQHPGRARILLGAARAAAALGDSAKSRALYAQVAVIWKDAEATWPGVAEARAASAHAAN